MWVVLGKAETLARFVASHFPASRQQSVPYICTVRILEVRGLSSLCTGASRWSSVATVRAMGTDPCSALIHHGPLKSNGVEEMHIELSPPWVLSRSFLTALPTRCTCTLLSNNCSGIPAWCGGFFLAWRGCTTARTDLHSTLTSLY